MWTPTPWLMGDGGDFLNVQAGAAMHMSADFDNTTNDPKCIDEHAFKVQGHTSMWLGCKQVYTWNCLLKLSWWRSKWNTDAHHHMGWEWYYEVLRMRRPFLRAIKVHTNAARLHLHLHWWATYCCTDSYSHWGLAKRVIECKQLHRFKELYYTVQHT